MHDNKAGSIITEMEYPKNVILYFDAKNFPSLKNIYTFFFPIQFSSSFCLVHSCVCNQFQDKLLTELLAKLLSDVKINIFRIKITCRFPYIFFIQNIECTHSTICIRSKYCDRNMRQINLLNSHPNVNPHHTFTTIDFLIHNFITRVYL